MNGGLKRSWHGTGVKSSIKAKREQGYREWRGGGKGSMKETPRNRFDLA